MSCFPRAVAAVRSYWSRGGREGRGGRGAGESDPESAVLAPGDVWARLGAAPPATLFAFRLDGAPARAVKVYDGDTVHLVFEHRGEVVRCSCRLLGVDAPELGRDGARAVAARDALAALVLGAPGGAPFVRLRATSRGPDKYGRLLVRLALPSGADVAETLLAAGHVRAYDGGARGTW